MTPLITIRGKYISKILFKNLKEVAQKWMAQPERIREIKDYFYIAYLFITSVN